MCWAELVAGNTVMELNTLTREQRPCLAAFPGNIMTITLSWKSKRGGWSMEEIKPTDLEARIAALFKRRLEAEAWLTKDREAIVAQIFKRDGRWIWWNEKN